MKLQEVDLKLNLRKVKLKVNERKPVSDPEKFWTHTSGFKGAS